MTDPLYVTNFIRWIEIGQAAFVLAVAVRIVFQYARLLRWNRQRVMPWHIVLVGASYVLLCFRVSCDIMARYNEVWTWRLPLSLAALVMGNVGLWLMNLHLKYESAAAAEYRKPTHCNNCGSRFVYEYCARCGQKQHPRARSPNALPPRKRNASEKDLHVSKPTHKRAKPHVSSKRKKRSD